MIGAPTWQRLGAAFEFRWDMHRITLSSFRESGGDLKAELAAEVMEGERWIPLSGLIIINLLAPRTRADTARALTLRDDTFPWADAIEAVAVIAVREYRRGGPIVNLADIPCSEHVRYLMDRLLPEGETSIIFGDGEAGKSMFSMFVAVAMATGYPLPHGIGPMDPGNVLYLDYESDVEEHARRMKKIANGLGVDVPRNIFYRESHRPIHEEADALAKEVAERDVQLIIVDSLAPACGDDPSAPGAAIATMNALRSLGGTRLAIGHVNKTDRDKPGSNQTTFGSIFWRNMTRSMWQLVPSQDVNLDNTAPFGLYNRKSNNAARERFPLGFRYTFSPDEYTLESYQIDAASSVAVAASPTHRVFMALGNKSMDTNEIAEMLDMTPDATRKLLTQTSGLYQVYPGTVGRNGKPAIWGIRGQ
jgi:hypothetical protein